MILTEFTELTGYGRCYASYVLRSHGKKIRINAKQVVIGDIRKSARRKRPRIYDAEVSDALKKVWYIMDCICGKRLAAILKEVVPRLERYREIRIEPEVRQKLLIISPATIDRLLAGERRKQTIKGKSNTKPGTLLRHQIPIRTFADWDDFTPGFVEMDLVDHSGGLDQGDFASTLNVTDVCTGWTEMRAVPTKAQKFVFEALTVIRRRLPVPLKGVDSDNGSEFINAHLKKYCDEEQITFTRGRVGRKNDNPFVEQKNWSIVRRLVAYQRYDSRRHVTLLNRLYDRYSVYANFFLPVTKLKEKRRIGSRVRKIFDKPQTPYARLLDSPDVSPADKRKLKARYASLDVVVLRREIDELLATLPPYDAK